MLLVDDNAIVRHSVRKVFEAHGYLICGEAENGQEAIEKAEKLHPDLVVLDLSMPVMNGLEAARVLSRTMPCVPLILFSNYADMFREEDARSAGISAVVSKDKAGVRRIAYFTKPAPDSLPSNCNVAICTRVGAYVRSRT